jgi:hypothetical protein
MIIQITQVIIIIISVSKSMNNSVINTSNYVKDTLNMKTNKYVNGKQSHF